MMPVVTGAPGAAVPMAYDAMGSAVFILMMSLACILSPLWSRSGAPGRQAKRKLAFFGLLLLISLFGIHSRVPLAPMDETRVLIYSILSLLFMVVIAIKTKTRKMVYFSLGGALVGFFAVASLDQPWSFLVCFSIAAVQPPLFVILANRRLSSINWPLTLASFFFIGAGLFGMSLGLVVVRSGFDYSVASFASWVFPLALLSLFGIVFGRYDIGHQKLTHVDLTG